MTQILDKVRDVDPNNSEEIKDVLTSFFQSLSKHVQIDCYSWLRILENTIKRFPKYCVSNKTTIETYLVNFLDSNSYANVVEAAKCVHALQQVRSSQEKGTTSKTNWKDLMNALCNAAHALIGTIFSKTIDIYQDNANENLESSNSPLSKALSGVTSVTVTQNSKLKNKQVLLCTRLRNVLIFTQAMLVEIYPVGKPVRPQTILDVIVRALSVSSGKISNDISEIMTVKIQALRTLDALVSCLGANLIPFSPLLFRFVMQTLKWSSENDCEQAREVKCAAYNTLSGWLNVLHSDRLGERGRSWEDELTAHVLSDITPHRHVIQLTASSQPTRHMSKKAKKKLAKTMLKESSIASHAPGEKNKIPIAQEIKDEVALAALQCTEMFLTVCGIFLKPSTHKLLQERIVRECYNIDSYSAIRGIHLLRVLECCRKTTPPVVPPPTQYCLHLYSVLINSTYTEISKFCSQALLDIRLHLHCSPPSLNFALEVQDAAPKKTEQKRRIMSKKNRAMLETLLGADRMPAEIEDEEVVTIHDEPTSKKPRIEELSDRISVSSESINSIEITDESDEECSVVQNVEAVIEKVNTNSANGDITDQTKEIKTVTEVTETIQEVDEATDTLTNERANEDVVDKTYNIYEVKTQMPFNESHDTNDEEDRPLSMEIAYDYPNTGKEKVTIIEKVEDDNLPSTNDTDDVQITCGQVVRNSQDNEKQKPEDLENIKILVIDEPKVNGVTELHEKPLENGLNEHVVSNITTKVAAINVEDMLADFVDEVNEDNPGA